MWNLNYTYKYVLIAGSSEAIMLAGLAMKKRWMAKRQAAGLPCDKPNLVMSTTVQVGGSCGEAARGA